LTSPFDQLDDDVHQRIRLGILALLAGVSRADFAHLKASLGTTDGNLGRHLQVLEKARLIDQVKLPEGQRFRTWVSITREGRIALEREIAALKAIVARVETTMLDDSRSRHAPEPEPGTA
jgi:DNA-binding MarR family transcriptional regulator